VAAFMLPGCLPGAKPPHMVELYTLDYTAAAPTGAPIEQLLKVERFAVAQSYNTSAMMYKPEGHKMGMYNYHKWRTNPGDMVTDFLARDFRSAGLFRAVFSSRQPDGARFVVEGGVEEFAESREAGGWKAALRLQVTLLDTDQSDVTGRVMFQKSYQAAEPIPERSPDAFARGMSAAMGKVSTRIMQDVHDAVRDRVK
jgi:cholesterol transport system auxiliary component